MKHDRFQRLISSYLGSEFMPVTIQDWQDTLKVLGFVGWSWKGIEDKLQTDKCVLILRSYLTAEYFMHLLFWSPYGRHRSKNGWPNLKPSVYYSSTCQTSTRHLLKARLNSAWKDRSCTVKYEKNGLSGLWPRIFLLGLSVTANMSMPRPRFETGICQI
jgi:hypothetical protein